MGAGSVRTQRKEGKKMISVQVVRGLLSRHPFFKDVSQSRLEWIAKETVRWIEEQQAPDTIEQVVATALTFKAKAYRLRKR